MGNIDTARILTRIGAILLVIGGFAQIGNAIIDIAFDWIIWSEIWITGIIWLALGIVTITFAFLILFLFIRKIGENNINAGIFILIFGLIASAGAWYFGWIGGILCLVAAILLFIEGSDSGGEGV